MSFLSGRSLSGPLSVYLSCPVPSCPGNEKIRKHKLSTNVFVVYMFYRFSSGVVLGLFIDVSVKNKVNH